MDYFKYHPQYKAWWFAAYRELEIMTLLLTRRELKSTYHPFSALSKLILLSITCLAAQSLSAQHISNGLVAYFPMNGDATDLSGNGNHALQDLPSALDRYGDSAGALKLDGQTNLETLYSPTQHVGNEFSVGLWLRLEQCAPQGMAVILAKASRLDSRRGDTRGDDEFLLALNHPNYQGSEECSVTVGTAQGPQDSEFPGLRYRWCHGELRDLVDSCRWSWPV